MTARSSTERMPIAVLISGGGTTLKNLIERRKADSLNADIKLVISSNPAAKGLKFAEDESIPAIVIERKDCKTAEEFSEAIFGPCRSHGIQLVVMGGFLKHVLIPPDFENRVTNIHPALIPAFCGKGSYGERVHRAVLDYGAKVSGCTVHFVDDHYDHGPIILQRTVPVFSSDSPASLASRIFEQECEAYPEAINLIASGKVKVEDRRVVVSD